MADDDDALIADIRNGSERAFNVLIDRHQQAVRDFLRRLLADASEADDLAQDTFMVAWTRPGTYRGDASVRSWLCAIAWHKAKGAQRACSVVVRAKARGLVTWQRWSPRLPPSRFSSAARSLRCRSNSVPRSSCA
jgi:RNA polymerase sigma factor (sigma-70 family)